MVTRETSRRSTELVRLADAVLQPGFVGTTPPDWVRRRLSAGLGGVALFARNIESPGQVAALTAALRAENPDVIVAVDEEGGDVTRLESRQGSSRPGNLALGAANDTGLTEAVAGSIGADLAAVGVTLDYAPDVDVNSNPNNPVIGVRSFGADPELVGRHTAAFVTGLQAAGVAACAKHFPGHGDTAVDSHHELPTVASSAEQIARLALPPFREAVRAGVVAIMTGHLAVPALDRDAPATMSQAILRDLLRGELGFDGLVVTDGIEMQAVSRRYGLAEAAVRALAAGADAVCVGGGHADEATADLLRDALVDAVTAGRLEASRLAEAADRVAAAAAWIRAAAPRRQAATDVLSAGTAPGLRAARLATRVMPGAAPDALPLRGPAHVVEFTPATNLAIGRETPWGLAIPLAGLLPGTTAQRVDQEAALRTDWATQALIAAADRPLVVVTRDAHRHQWLSHAVTRLLDHRPDGIVVEMGLPAPASDLPGGAARIITHGAAIVCGQAAAEVLTGRR